MRKAIQLSIPKSCHENWDAMTPKDKGRHCKVCEKLFLILLVKPMSIL
ncbi:hypothetical protein [Pontimicrobium sp. MEBiC06410]